MLIAVLVVAVFMPAHAFASTSVGGRVSESATWTASASPYVLTSDLEVANSALLTLEPGVEIGVTATRSRSSECFAEPAPPMHR